MRAVIQRVSHASVTIDGTVHGAINQGFLVLLGVCEEDAQEDVDWLVKKIANLRVFDDENHVMNRSIMDVGGEILVVSQFTLASDPFAGGNRPGFENAMEKDGAEEFYNRFVAEIRAKGFEVGTGVFGAHMMVRSVNAGPLTFIFEL